MRPPRLHLPLHLPFRLPFHLPLRRWALRLLDGIVPAACPLCGEDHDPAAPAQVSFSAPLCGWCRDALPGLGAERCPVCALRLEPTGRCPDGAHADYPLDQAWCLADFAPPFDQLIHRFKYLRRTALAGTLADAMAATLRATPLLSRAVADRAVLVPVPLSRQRLQARGYNQSALLAAQLGRRLGLPVAPRLLTRQHEADPQAGRTRAERLASLVDAFAPAQSLPGTPLLLVDDVMTTGATLGEAARCLRRHGATEVGAWVAARTPVRPAQPA